MAGTWTPFIVSPVGDEYELPTTESVAMESLESMSPIDEAVQAVRDAQDSVGVGMWEDG